MNDDAIKAMIASLQALLTTNSSEAPPTGPTFGELAERYLTRAAELGQDAVSARCRLAALTEFFGCWPVDLIDASAWAAYKAARRAGGTTGGHYAVSTSCTELALAKTVCALAVEAETIARNPFAKIKPERGANKRRETISEAELQRILDAIDVPWFRAYVLLLADSGLRRTEGLRVRWADVERGHAHVARADSKGKVARSVKLTDRARDALLALGRPAGAEFVFASRRAGCETISKPRLATMFRDAVKRAGVVLPGGKLPTCHYLRHSFASRASRRCWRSARRWDTRTSRPHRSTCTHRSPTSTARCWPRPALHSLHERRARAAETAGPTVNPWTRGIDMDTIPQNPLRMLDEAHRLSVEAEGKRRLAAQLLAEADEADNQASVLTIEATMLRYAVDREAFAKCARETRMQREAA